jgi:type 1 glutamine amidotransferase
MRAAFLAMATVAAITVGFAQAPAPGSESVRVPAWRQLRTAVGPLLGWQVGVPVGSFRQDTFVEAARKAEALDLAVIEGDDTQKVSVQIPKSLDYRLAPGELSAVRERMTTLNLRMPAYVVGDLGVSEPTARKVFEFAKNLGVETLVVERAPDRLMDKLADEYGINIALSGTPTMVLEALQGRSQRIGAYADLGKWMREGIAPLDGVLLLKERLLVLRLSDRSALGAGGHVVPLGTGVAGIAPLLAEIYKRGLKPSLITVDATGGPDVAVDLKRSLENFEKAVQPVVAERVMQLSRTIPIKGPDRLTPEEREHITAATARKAAAPPKSPRKLLVYDANIGYGGATGGHRSIPAANMAIQLFASATGAYEAVFSNDLDNFKYDRIKKFDAVFLNNSVGQIFVDPAVRDGLARFVREGGGLAGYHGASHASMDWPEFGQMIGAVEGAHREPTEMATVKIDDPSSPLVAAFQGKSFVHQDEFYRFVEPPLSRDKVHVLMSIDIDKTDLNQGRACARPCVRADGDYVLSWIHTYGKGRVFFTSLGHTPAFFADPNLSDFFFRGIQFVLGDLDADTTPSAKVHR